MKPDLIRGVPGGAIELRAEGDESGVLTGHFSVFNLWYPIASAYEGRFLESVAPGAFGQTITEDRDSMVVGFDHGLDPQIGNKPLGTIEDLREDARGAFYSVALLDTDYVRGFILPALQGRTLDGRKLGTVLGSSMRMVVLEDDWNMAPERSKHNPDRIPERTIRRAKVKEFGPVVYPANPAATAETRSLMDRFYEGRSLALPTDLTTPRDAPAVESDRSALEHPTNPGARRVLAVNPWRNHK